MCEEWRLDFQAFLAHVGQRPEGTSLDRKDVNGDYEPGNVRWATSIDQANNRRDTCRVALSGGREFTLSEICRFMGVNVRTVTKRIALGWSLGRAIARPVAA